jgi:hypothetical protein
MGQNRWSTIESPDSSYICPQAQSLLHFEWPFMNCLIHAISFSFEMCLANEVKLETLTKKNHGQVRRVGVLFLIAVTTINYFSASKYGLRRKRLPSGRLCTLEKSVLAFSLYMCFAFLFRGHECSLSFQVQERKNRS